MTSLAILSGIECPPPYTERVSLSVSVRLIRLPTTPDRVECGCNLTSVPV